MTNKTDHSTLQKKILLRRYIISQIENPVILEAYGGTGRIYSNVYSQIKSGVVIEKNSERTELLARQRPTWSVWQGDSIAAIKSGVGSHLVFNLLDVDPWGDPWPAISAYISSPRELAPKFWIVVNDGLRKKTMLGGSWHTHSLDQAVLKFGNNLFPIYDQVCKWIILNLAESINYELSRFFISYCGSGQTMTHYAALLARVRSTRGNNSKRPKG